MSCITCRNGETADTYQDYLRTTHWSVMRKKIKAKYKGKCACCGFTAKDEIMHVHHLTYERVGKERLTDLVLLCESCHKHVHAWMRTMRGDNLGKHAFEVVRKSFQMKPRNKPKQTTKKKSRKRRRKRKQ